MQKSDTIDESPIVKELSNVASTAIHELEMTKQSLKEKELELKEIAEISKVKLNSAIKNNQDLQNKVQLLLDLSNSLETKNNDLEEKNNELTIRENTYNILNRELKDQLEHVSKNRKRFRIEKKVFRKTN